jgi:hypothetical protein
VKMDPRLLDALLDSTRGALPDGVTVERVGQGGIRVLGRGAYVAGPSFGGLPLPQAARLRFSIRRKLQAVADGVTHVTGEPWPADGAVANVRISESQIEMWFGPKDQPQNAVIQLPTLPRPK